MAGEKDYLYENTEEIIAGIVKDVCGEEFSGDDKLSEHVSGADLMEIRQDIESVYKVQIPGRVFNLDTTFDSIVCYIYNIERKKECPEKKTIEDLVLSIEQVNHLKELGYEIKNSVYSWYENSYTHTTWVDTLYDANHSVRTLTLQEIFDILPSRITVGMDMIDYDLAIEMPQGEIMYRSWNNDKINDCLFFEEGTNILEVAYKTLCWVVEKGLFNKAENGC